MQSSDGEAENRSGRIRNEAADIQRVRPENTDLVQNGSILASTVHESVHAVDVPVRQLPFQEDELLAWLQYPIDDLLDSSYCGSDLFGDFPNPNVQLVKHSLNHIGFKPQETPIPGSFAARRGALPPYAGISGLGLQATGSCGSGSDACGAKHRVAGADAAMAGGAGRAAGLTSQSGAEVFGIVRTTMQPSLAKCPHFISPVSNSEGLDVQFHPLNKGSCQGQNFTTAYATTSLPIPALPGKPDNRNFTHFSRPIVETKATLHMVGAGSGPTSLERVRQQAGKSGRLEPNSVDYSLEESVTTVSGMSPYAAQFHTVEASQHHGAEDEGWQPPPAATSCGPESDEGNEKIISRDNIINSSMCNGAFAACEKGFDTLEVGDPTATSPSRGSDSSTEKSGKEVAMTSKRKLTVGEDTGYQSEGADEFATNNKKPPSGAKRSRAARIHNESERRRRDRINEKMKALQDLIPNANKTDKASVLDEAIEYMKLLQSQLQTMSMRTGIGIPPSVIPGMGMQHMQMPTLQHMSWGVGAGMGVGLGMGFGMGTMDANAAAAAGHTMLPMPPLPGPPHVGPPSHAVGPQACNRSLSMTGTHENLQGSIIWDPRNLYIANQQIQPTSSNPNMHKNLEMYNMYVLQQQQQQQQQQQWHQQLLQSRQSRGVNGSKPVQ